MHSQELYVTVFRCLNANGHGTMVRGDWTILQQVTDDAFRTAIYRAAPVNQGDPKETMDSEARFDRTIQ